MPPPLRVATLWVIFAVLVTGFWYASLRAIKLLFGSHDQPAPIPDSARPNDGQKAPSNSNWLHAGGPTILSTIPWLVIGGGFAFGAMQYQHDLYVLEALQPEKLPPQVLDNGQAALNAALVAKLVAQGADLTTLTRSVTSVNQQLDKSAQQIEKAAFALQQAASSQADAASSGAKSADQLREAATKLDSAATAASAAASNNAESMKQLMAWAGATTQNVSTVSKEVSYLNDVTVKAGGTMAVAPKPLLVIDLKESKACASPFRPTYELTKDLDGLWQQEFICRR